VLLGAAALGVWLRGGKAAGAAPALALAAILHSPAFSWLLGQALRQGIKRETARDMATPELVAAKWMRPGLSDFLVAERAEDGAVVGCVAVVAQHTFFKEARRAPGSAVGSAPAAGGGSGGGGATDPAPDAMPGEASIWRLSVDGSARRLGVGRLLMAEAERWAAEHGCAHVSLVTGNADSQAFYRRLGYAVEAPQRARVALFGAAAQPTGVAGWAKAWMLRSRTDPARGTVFAKAISL
jgi:ribosomal protein S18 acetylase RimI-like enzyme